MALPGPSSNNLVGSSYDTKTVELNAAEVVRPGTGSPNVKYQPNGWYWSKLDGLRWDKLYPFQVMVVEKKGKSYVPVKDWTFTLPVPPESMNISMPFAISSAVTLDDGVVEEHNGAPIRNISITGSFGVNPARASASTVSNNVDFFTSIIGGTISQGERTISAIQNVAQSQNGSSAFWKKNVHSKTDFGAGGNLERFTGYYQWRLFQMFMEGYVAMKKKAEHRNKRLAFAVWKEEAVYLVTPQVLDVRRAAGSPLEYIYTFTMRATGRVQLGQSAAQIIPFMGINRTPTGFLQTLLTSISSARGVLLEVGRLPLALSNDLKALGLEPLRELTFFAKDALALPLSFADVADSFVSDAKWAIVDALNTANAGKHIKQNIIDRYKQTGRKAQEAYAMIEAVAAERSDNNGKGGETHPVHSVFNDPQSVTDLFASILVGDVQLTPKLISRLQDERDRIRSMSTNDLKALAEKLKLLLSLVSDALGTSDSTYSSTYGTPTRGNPSAPAGRGSPMTPTAPTAYRGSPTLAKEPSDEDFETMYALNQVIMDLNSVIAAKTDENNRLLSSLEYMAGLAQRSGVAFNVPVSKFAVPFPYGSTLESIALRYLGNANRWLEIAALNGLQEPYVDEVGFEQELLVNGSGNTVLVADASHYYVGQTVWIGSRAVARVKRNIVKLVHLAPNQHQIVVDGDSNLGQYQTLAGAYIHAFLPNTVNSQMLLYIPSNEQPGASDFKTKEIPGVKEFDHMIVVGGVDILLDSTNDIVLGPDGSDRWAVGLTNMVQKVRLAFATPRGSLLDHPEFGNPIKVGMSIADLDPGQAVETIQMMFSDDPSFSGVKAVQLEAQGPVAKIGTAVEIAGTSQVVPISVEIRQ